MIKNTESIIVEIPNLTQQQKEELAQLPNAYQAEYKEMKVKISFAGGTQNIIHVLDYLKKNGIVFGNMYSQLPTLNDVFLEITGKELRD